MRIVAVDAETVGESMRHFVKGSMMDYTKVDEVRRVLEVAAAGLAAQRATAEDIAIIDDTIVRFENECSDLDASVEIDIEFHRAIGAATHNELFLMLHDSIGQMLVEVRRRNLSRGRPERRLVVEMHRDPRRHRGPRRRGGPAGDARPPRPRAGDVDGRDHPRRRGRVASSAEGKLVLFVGHDLEQRRPPRLGRRDAPLQRAASSWGRSTRSACPPRALPRAV